MKKGFTLVELLIVMVIVTVLVTVAVPKHKTAMERARGQEGLANAAAISDAINAYYVLHGNSYGENTDAVDYALGPEDSNNNRTGGVAGVVKSNYFRASVSNASTTPTVTVARINNSYSIVFVSQNGDITERYCTGDKRYCNIVGAVGTRSGGGWTF